VLPTEFGNRFSKINILRPGAVGAPRRYLTEIPMPVMVDSEGKCVFAEKKDSYNAGIEEGKRIVLSAVDLGKQAETRHNQHREN